MFGKDALIYLLSFKVFGFNVIISKTFFYLEFYMLIMYLVPSLCTDKEVFPAYSCSQSFSNEGIVPVHA